MHRTKRQCSQRHTPSSQPQVIPQIRLENTPYPKNDHDSPPPTDLPPRPFRRYYRWNLGRIHTQEKEQQEEQTITTHTTTPAAAAATCFFSHRPAEVPPPLSASINDRQPATQPPPKLRRTCARPKMIRVFHAFHPTLCFPSFACLPPVYLRPPLRTGPREPAHHREQKRDECN
ncbi:hypothetical protein B0T18DRAFT_210876 [Schizothecium vesticola]|uniref:Uncharacterized protein n=1 Tax=Schizothecium vesticola TaxID=314040 RepID=A0AA40EJK3_9PEZI|nr:hypothetical protein B0T18DRAFT_210876 [Schizothecium vesticola]